MYASTNLSRDLPKCRVERQAENGYAKLVTLETTPDRG